MRECVKWMIVGMLLTVSSARVRADSCSFETTRGRRSVRSARRAAVSSREPSSTTTTSTSTSSCASALASVTESSGQRPRVGIATVTSGAGVTAGGGR